MKEREVKSKGVKRGRERERGRETDRYIDK